MKIFSLLLLQCKEKACRMESCLAIKRGTLRRASRPPSEADYAFMGHHRDIILSTDLDGRPLIKMVQESLRSCALEDAGADKALDALFMTDQDISGAMAGDDMVQALGREKVGSLYALLFGLSLASGELECSRCRRMYPVTDGIVDFIDQ